MKQIKKPANKPKGSWKAKLLMALMFLQAVFANALEGVVVSQRDVPSGKNTTTYVGIDNTNDGRADFYIVLPFTNGMGLRFLLKEELSVGSTITYSDNAMMRRVSELLELYSYDILAINGENILDIFPNSADVFTVAAAQRAAAQRANGGR